MQVNLYAGLRAKAGTKTVEVELSPGATVEDALNQLAIAHPALHGVIWREDGSPSPQVRVLVNGRNIAHLDGLATALDSADKIDLFPPVVGGAALYTAFGQADS